MSTRRLQEMLRQNPVVVTGMGAFTAAGNSVEALWNAAINGRSTAAWRKFSDQQALCRMAVCSAPELDRSLPEFRFVRKMDRSVQMAWAASREAWNQAGLQEGFFDPQRIGVVVGTSRGPIGRISESVHCVGRERMAPSLTADCTMASLSGAISHIFGTKGEAATISAACISGASAIILAAEQLLLGKADAMLVGGAEAPLAPVVLAQLQSLGVLGTHDDARRACRPFDTTLGMGWFRAKEAHFWCWNLPNPRGNAGPKSWLGLPAGPHQRNTADAPA